MATTPAPTSATPVPQIGLESSPEVVTLPTTGQEDVLLTLRVAPLVSPGLYRLDVMPQVSGEMRKQGPGEIYGTRGRQLTVKVTLATP